MNLFASASVTDKDDDVDDGVLFKVKRSLKRRMLPKDKFIWKMQSGN